MFIVSCFGQKASAKLIYYIGISLTVCITACNLTK